MTSARGGRRTAPDLRRLIEVGLLMESEPMVGISRRPAGRFAAHLSADGRVRMPTGEMLPDLDEAAAFALGKPRKGWEFWHVSRNGATVPLKDIRALGVKATG
ncbi:restriction system modified-DNA reader domain-containing protein [Rugosimonospora africana]